MLPCTERVVASIGRRLFRSYLSVSSRRRCNITAFMPEAAGFEGVSDRCALQDFSVSNSEKFWAAAARHRLSWIRTFDGVRDCDLSRGKIKWFEGGKLNVSGKISSMTLSLKDIFSGDNPEALRVYKTRIRHVESTQYYYDLLWHREEIHPLNFCFRVIF